MHEMTYNLNIYKTSFQRESCSWDIIILAISLTPQHNNNKKIFMYKLGLEIKTNPANSLKEVQSIQDANSKDSLCMSREFWCHPGKNCMQQRAGLHAK